MIKLITNKILWLLSSLLIISSLGIQAEVGEPTVNVITTTLINKTGSYGSAIELETEAKSIDPDIVSNIKYYVSAERDQVIKKESAYLAPCCKASIRGKVNGRGFDYPFELKERSEMHRFSLGNMPEINVRIEAKPVNMNNHKFWNYTITVMAR